MTSLIPQNFNKIKRQHFVRRLHCRSHVKKKPTEFMCDATLVVSSNFFFSSCLYFNGFAKDSFLFKRYTLFTFFLPVSSFTTQPLVAIRCVVFYFTGFLFSSFNLYMQREFVRFEDIFRGRGGGRK